MKTDMVRFCRIPALIPLISLILASLACSALIGKPTISNIRMTSDDAGKILTNSYSPTDEFFVFADLSGLKVGSLVEAKWYAVNASGVEANSLINISDYHYAPGIDFVSFNLTTSDGSKWPIGFYKVDLYLDGVFSGEELFTVK
jgi:hypothetical protein